MSRSACERVGCQPKRLLSGVFKPWVAPMTSLFIGALLSVAPLSAYAESSGSQTAAAANHSAADSHRHPADAPFAFRGIALGITLDEFRAGSTVRATPVGSVPVCETDMLAGALGMSLKTSESLTVACRWAHRTADRWALSQAVVDGVPAQDHVLRFARGDGQSALRLYEMSFMVDEPTAGDLRDALEARYGPPKLVTRNVSAGSSPVPVYVWENSVSSITLCFLPASHSGTLTYLLKDPDAFVKSLVRQWQASSSDAG
jgi:hypothetical protein